MKYVLASLAAVACLLVVALPATADEKSTDAKAHKFEWKFPTGEVRRFDSSQTFKQETDLGAFKMSMTMDTSYTTTHTCKGVDEEGVREIEIRYDSVAFKLNMPMMGATEYDSRTAGDDWARRNPTLRGATLLAGKSITVFVTPRGEVKKITGLDELAGQVLGGMTSPAKETFGSILDEESLRELYRAYGEFPEDGAVVGQSWELNKDLKPAEGGGMKIEAAYKLEQVTAKDGAEIADVSFNGTFELNPGDEQPMELEITDQKVEGKVQYNLTEGEILGSKSTLSFTAKVETPDGSLTMKTTSSSSYKRVPVETATNE